MSWPAGVPAKQELRAQLARAHPWLTDPDRGPSAVEAGACDRCKAEPRLVQTCGPGPWTALGRRCAAQAGEEAWCDGHRDDARLALDWLRTLPDYADDLAWLWWLTTGEVRPGLVPESAVGAVEVEQRLSAGAMQLQADDLADDE